MGVEDLIDVDVEGGTSKYGTHRVDPEAEFKDKEWLTTETQDKGKSDAKIASQFNVDPETVRYWRKKFGIPASHKYTKPLNNEPSLTRHQMDVLEGDLMGDGSVVKNGNKSRYQGSNNKREYLEFVKTQLPDKMFTDSCWQKDRDTHHLNSRAIDAVDKIRDKWYPDGEKSLPDGFSLTSTHLLHWYIGDGDLKQPESSPRIRARWLSEENAYKLKDQMEYMFGNGNVTIYISGKDKRFHFNHEGRDRFFRFVGSCPVDDYKYKWIPKYR